MISEQAKVGVDRIFAHAAKSTLRVAATDAIEVEPMSARLSVAPNDDQIVVLTIASYRFRLLVLFHVSADHAVRRYFGEDADTEVARSFDTAFGEIGNLCCGAMKRDLGLHFPHTGLSTPYTLDGRCQAFLDALKPHHVSRHRIVINSIIQLHATLCLCAYAPIDFIVPTQRADEETGVLELF